MIGQIQHLWQKVPAEVRLSVHIVLRYLVGLVVVLILLIALFLGGFVIDVTWTKTIDTIYGVDTRIKEKLHAPEIP